MKKLFAAVFALVLSSATAQAATIDFDFRGNGGLAPSYTFTQSGVSVTATAASFTGTGDVSTSPHYKVGQYWGGLGMSRKWDNSHEVDGKYGNDLIVFDFDRTVTLESVSFTHVDRDDGFSFFFDAGADGSLDSDNLGFNVDIPESGTYSFAKVWTGDLFGIGAYDGTIFNTDDFKISGISVSVVPLPAALPLFGAGLLVTGFIAHRRKRKNLA